MTGRRGAAAATQSGASKKMRDQLRIPDSRYIDFIKYVAKQIVKGDVTIRPKGEEGGKPVADIVINKEA